MFLCLIVSGASQTVSSKHVLIMDEVDGMAGNEDRGGIQVDIQLHYCSSPEVVLKAQKWTRWISLNPYGFLRCVCN